MIAELRHRLSKPGWHYYVVDEDNAHVWPCRDGWDHDLDHGDDCLCGVKVIPVMRADGSGGWIYHHTSLDGREKREQEDSEKTAVYLDARLVAAVAVVLGVLTWVYRRFRR